MRRSTTLETDPMITNLTEDVAVLTTYLARRHKANGSCPVSGCTSPDPTTLAALLHRYPFLYRRLHKTNQDSVAVEQLQQRMQKKFEVQLSRYVIDQMRRSRFSPIDTTITPIEPGVSTDRISNPTLISYVGVMMGTQRFTGKVWGAETHNDLAQRFLRQTKNNTFIAFKRSLHTYLIASIPRSYRDSHFPSQLWKCLEGLMPERHDQPIDRFLLSATCRRLFQLLTVESSKNLDHHILIDLVSNIDPLCVAELLLRILLLCPHSRVHLNKRMRILFEHYANQDQADLRWLIQLFEYLNLAYSTNFGTVTLPVRAGNLEPLVSTVRLQAAA